VSSSKRRERAGKNNRKEKTVYDYFEEYLQNRKRTGYRDIRKQKIAIKNLILYLEQMSLSINELHYKQAIDYKLHLIEKKKKDGTPYSTSGVNTYLKGALSFCSFLKKKSVILTNPFKETKLLREENKLPRSILKEAEMDTFLFHLACYEEQSGLLNKIRRYRTHVIAELMYATGMRIAEVAQLKKEDIDFTNSVVTIREGKGGSSRQAFLNDYAKEVLYLYVTEMKELTDYPVNRKGYLFGMTIGSLTHILNRELKQVGKKMGFTRITSHMFRHAFGYHLLRAGCNIRHIQHLMGHKKIKNTEVYTKVEKEDLLRILETYHPRRMGRKCK